MRRVIQKKRKSKQNIKKIFLLLLVTFAVLFLLGGKIFTISHIKISGNKRLSEEKIYTILDLDEHTNMIQFLWKSYFLQEQLDPRIESININATFPNQIEIDVIESSLIGYVPFMGTYLCIDKYGQVIEETKYIEEDKPILLGLNFKDFTIGQVLEVSEKEKYSVLLQICNILKKYDIENTIIKVDISNEESIYLFTRYLEISCGDFSRFDEKMNVLTAIMKKIEKQKRGILYLENIDKPIPFKVY